MTYVPPWERGGEGKMGLLVLMDGTPLALHLQYRYILYITNYNQISSTCTNTCGFEVFEVKFMLNITRNNFRSAFLAV